MSQLGQIQFTAIDVTSHVRIDFAMLLTRLLRTALGDQIWSEMNEEWAEYVHGESNSPAFWESLGKEVRPEKWWTKVPDASGNG